MCITLPKKKLENSLTYHRTSNNWCSCSHYIS